MLNLQLGVNGCVKKLVDGKIELMNKHLRKNPKLIKRKDIYLDHAKNWDEQTASILYQKLFEEKIRMIKGDYVKGNVQKIPKSVRGTVFMWKAGIDPAGEMPRATYYRHKKICREKLGIDISMPCPSGEFRNIIPMIRVLEAIPAGIPDFAYRYNLVA